MSTGFGRSGLPARVSELTPTWLSGAIDGGGVVRRATVLWEDTGTTGRARLGLTWDPAGPAGPDQVFVKLVPSARGPRVFTALMGLGANEVAVYRHLGAELPVPVPRVHGARAEGRRFVLILEDLAARNCSFPNVAEECTEERADQIMQGLGRLHGRYWASPRFDAGGDLDWVTHPARDPHERLGRWIVALALRSADRKCAETIPEAVRRDSKILVERRRDLEAAWAEEPLTLLHGDPHQGNTYGDGGADGPPGFLDWQVARQGPGLRDVAYFLLTSLPVEQRRRDQDSLLATYLRSLASAGGPVITTETAWEQLRGLAAYAYIAATVTVVAGGGLQRAEIALSGLQRATAGVRDLGTFPALRALLAGA